MIPDFIANNLSLPDQVENILIGKDISDKTCIEIFYAGLDCAALISLRFFLDSGGVMKCVD